MSLLLPDRSAVRELAFLAVLGVLTPLLFLGLFRLLPEDLGGGFNGTAEAILSSFPVWALLLSVFVYRRYRAFCARVPALSDSLQASDRSRNLGVFRDDREALQVFRSLIDQSNEALFIIDTVTARIVDANQQACRNLGYSYSQLTRLRVGDISSNYGKQIPRWSDYMARIRQAGQMVFEARHLRRDGSTFPVEVSTRMIAHGTREYLVSVVRDISERKEREAELERLATTDPLTGIANRRYLYELLDHQLELLRRYGEPCTLVLVDIDHFKAVNDRFGHGAGDAVLVEITKR
ncbi:MAG TPA: diguanylate cyclase, partial [Gammaproteobacteria bacterium]|nr:diguanylate cyclase [Gammaproteobacteria bacterium]